VAGSRVSHVRTRHRSTLQRQAAHHSNSPADADDALQDACVQFLRNYDGPPGADALRWMMLVTKRCAWAIGARQRRHQSHIQLNCTDGRVEPGVSLAPRADSHLDPANLAERAEQQANRVSALRHLKPDERTALMLLAFGFSYREIAA
jgi:DNA-directed RNA polymerase specialized sigma24 family protein